MSRTAETPGVGRSADVGQGRHSLRPFLWFSVPIALLAMAASVAGVVSEGTYAGETSNWAAQAVGQDAVNLAVYPVLLLLARAAARGSLGAYLVWLGVLAYTAYSYVIYAGFTHFGPWFLVYVAILGLSGYALIGGLAVLDPTRVRGAFGDRAPARPAGGVLVAFGGLYALLWLSEILPAAISGETPEPVDLVGLPTNPVWVLDLAFVLPAMVAAGLLLWRRRALGYVLAPPLLTFGVAMGVAVQGMFVSMAGRGEDTAVVAVVMMAITVLAEGAVLVALLGAQGRRTALSDALRSGWSAPTGGRTR